MGVLDNRDLRLVLTNTRGLHDPLYPLADLDPESSPAVRPHG